MHFKLGLYEHQSASAIDGLINLLSEHHQEILKDGDINNIKKINIIAYEPAFSIIGDPAKMKPTTRQSADHSMPYIISTLLRKAFEKQANILEEHDPEDLWKYLMLLPADYNHNALFCEVTRTIMDKVHFTHGGPEYDELYPQGIPTSISITMQDDKTYDSGMVLYPGGHAHNETVSLSEILQHKFIRLG